MSLQKKILDLKLHAALAVKHAQGWQRLIDLYGEQQATDFYTHLGLNHLGTYKHVPCQGCDGKHGSCARCGGKGYIEVEVKSFDYDDLTLSREPKPHEALQVKAIAQAQESAKERLATIMTSIRSELVTEALDQLGQLDPASYHKLIITVDTDDRDTLRELVDETFNDGRLLIMVQRGGKQTELDDFDDELDILTDITTSRLANGVQARIIGAAARLALLGLTDAELLAAVTSETNAASVSYIDRAATGLANRTLNLGRSAEASRFEWQRVEYSALLDANVCGPCADADGQEASNEADLTPAPNPECEGYDNCRCFHVFVQD